MYAASSCCSVGSQRKWFRCSFLRCRGSRLTLLSIMTDISSHFRVHGGTKLYRGSESTVVSLVSSGNHRVWTRVCIPFSFVWVAFSVVFNSYLNGSLHQLNWFHQMRVIHHESLMNSILPMRLIDHKSCGLHVDSHDALRWLTMRILRYRCSQFFAILFAKHSIYNLSHNYRNQIRVKENHFPTPTE